MFYRKLYLSACYKKKKRKLVKKLKKGEFVPDLFVITLSEGDNLLEFYQSFQLKQPYYKEHFPYIVGLAKGYSGAIELVTQILSDAFEKTGEYNIRKLCFEE